jgi:hypothetical protein
MRIFADLDQPHLPKNMSNTNEKCSIPVVERMGASVVVRKVPSDMMVPPAAVTTIPGPKHQSGLSREIAFKLVRCKILPIKDLKFTV